MSINIVALQVLARLLSLGGFDGIFGEPYLRRFRVPVGEKWATGDNYIVGFYYRSNKTHPIVDFRGTVLHRLSDPTDSDTYCNGEMLSDLESLLDPGPTHALVGVVDLVDLSLTKTPTRIGNVIEYEITSRVIVDTV